METPSEPLGLSALDRAIKLVGLGKLAASLDVQYQMIQGWRKDKRQFAAPAEYCPAIERATGRAVTCEELRPDVDWAYLRGTAPAPTKEAA